MNLKITFLVKVKVRINRGITRDTDTDNVVIIIPVDFGKMCRIKIQTVPFGRDMPNAIQLNLMAFMEDYLD